MSLGGYNTIVEQPENSGRAASHFAELARALVVMGEMATTLSSSTSVGAREAAAIRHWLPALAARYGLAADVEDSGAMLTVTFTRRSD